MSERARLPNRRKSVTAEVEGAGMTATVSVGFYPDGSPAETFLTSGKVGSAIDALLGDAAVVVSIALQHGIPASELRKSIARHPDTLEGPATAPSSLLGAALDLLASYEPDQP